MKIKEHDIVSLKGTVVYIYKTGKAIEVEISNADKRSQLITVPIKDITLETRPKKGTSARPLDSWVIKDK